MCPFCSGAAKQLNIVEPRCSGYTGHTTDGISPPQLRPWISRHPKLVYKGFPGWYFFLSFLDVCPFSCKVYACFFCELPNPESKYAAEQHLNSASVSNSLVCFYMNFVFFFNYAVAMRIRSICTNLENLFHIKSTIQYINAFNMNLRRH